MDVAKTCLRFLIAFKVRTANDLWVGPGRGTKYKTWSLEHIHLWLCLYSLCIFLPAHFLALVLWKQTFRRKQLNRLSFQHKAVWSLRKLILWEIVTRSPPWVRITEMLMARWLFRHEPTGLNCTLNKPNNHIPKTCHHCCQSHPLLSAWPKEQCSTENEGSGSRGADKLSLLLPLCSRGLIAFSLSCSGRCWALPELSNVAAFKQQNSL